MKSETATTFITTFKTRKGSKDFVSPCDYSCSTLMLWSDENTFCAQK